jgi:AraC-like DNA-binding protein
MPDRVIREDTFTTRDQPEKHQFDCWREEMAPMIDVSRTNEAGNVPGFVAEAKGYDLGKILFAQATIDSESYEHSHDHIRKGGGGHWIFTVRKTGFAVSRSGDRVLQSSAGTLELRSLAYTYSGSASKTEALYVFLDRDEFSGMAEELDAANHTLLRGNTSTLVREFLLKVETYLPSLRLAELAVVNESISTLLAASMQPTESTMMDAQLPMAAARFELARRYIEAHLADPDLNAERVSLALGISRRQIYYLFERHSGVANFIRKRRLAACHEAIANSADHRLIQTIAYKYGFNDPAQFSRQFRREYGYSPSEARHAKLLGYKPDQSRPRNFYEWINQVRND